MIFDPFIDRILRHHRKFLYWTYRRDFEAHGKTQTWGWRMTNVMLHMIVAAVIYAIVRGFFSPFSAGIGTAVAVVHPLGNSAVSSISARSSVLSGVFYLGALLSALIGGVAWLVVGPLFYLGYCAKQDVLILPVVVVITLKLIY